MLETNITERYRDFRIAFDKEFLRLCESRNLLPITGDSRKGFRIKGIIEVTIDFENAKSLIGTYSRKTKLPSVNLNDLITEIERVHKRLFEREWAPNDFLQKLYDAYQLVSKGQLGREVLLREVQLHIWLKRQGDVFYKSFDTTKTHEYPTDEFAVDLARLINTKDASITDLAYRFSEGMDGVNVYDSGAHVRSFKFISFSRRGQQ